MSIDGMLLDLQQNWWLYAAMPVVAALIGYGTKRVAIRMMFEPLEFVGIRPWLGWQGIVPRKAEAMANIAVDTVTRELVTAGEMFDRLDPERVARELEKPLLAMIDDIVRDVAAAYRPGLWDALPERVRAALVGRIQADAPRVVAEMMADVRNNLDRVFDLRAMIVGSLVRDKRLLNRMFRQVGREEFRFIARSGIWFGFAIGCVQAVVWALTHSPWVMPLFGGFVGWFSDWLALKMVFEPREERRILGLFRWQGLFLRRRLEVAREYGRLIASELITPRNVIEAVLRGPASDRLFDLVQKHVHKLIDEQAGVVRPLVVFAVDTRQYQQMKIDVAARLMARAPEALGHVERYATDAIDLERTLVEKMQQLSVEQFEGLLRPVFKQDEWILISVGAVLGFLVGELQVLVMLHH